MGNLSKIKKILALLFVGVVLFANLSMVALAADPANPNTNATPGTLLPEATKTFTMENCQGISNAISSDVDSVKAALSNHQNLASLSWGDDTWDNLTNSDILGCSIKTGDIPLWMVPFFIRYILEFIIGISGLICVGGIVYGGFTYMFAGLGEDKEKGKKAIMYGIIGMVMSMLAWAFVNIVMAIVTI